MTNRYAAHQALVADVLAAIGSRPDIRVWPNSTGVGRALTHEAIIRFGLKGSADIIGLTSDGRFIGLECKTGGAVRSKPQIAFAAMIQRFGGRYAVVRSVHDAVVFLDALGLAPRISC